MNSYLFAQIIFENYFYKIIFLDFSFSKILCFSFLIFLYFSNILKREREILREKDETTLLALLMTINGIEAKFQVNKKHCCNKWEEWWI